jgi:heme/copper-type cytochrome/quinol oxidase subunit 3
MDIPYTHTTRPDTGLTNATLGMWLFLSSAVMLFGALFSSYAILRSGADSWPDQSAVLDVPLGALNTVLLLASSAALQRRRVRVTLALGAGFLGVKGFEWAAKIAEGLLPSASNFLGLYYAMTGLHALHVAGGLLVLAWFAAARKPLAAITTYWHFVDAIWIVLFAVLYLS